MFLCPHRELLEQVAEFEKTDFKTTDKVSKPWGSATRGTGSISISAGGCLNHTLLSSLGAAQPSLPFKELLRVGRLPVTRRRAQKSHMGSFDAPLCRAWMDVKTLDCFYRQKKKRK